MYDKGLVAGSEGNLSCLDSEHNLFISSSGICKGRMDESDINRIDFDGNNIEGNKQPSSEFQLHISGYKANSSYLAAVHLLEEKLEDMLPAKIEEQWWHEAIRLYAALTDASKIMQACIGNPIPSVNGLMLAFIISVCSSSLRLLWRE